MGELYNKLIKFIPNLILMLNKVELQKRLQEVVNTEPSNLDEILNLSRQLALLDEDNARFLVDAGVIDRLGKELVARHETAVSELVKNSFDADATFANIFFNDVNDYGGQLIIDDSGNGMTREQLLNGFMRISSTEKIHEPESPLYKRKRAGRKGIGRFATQRLGNVLTIITQTENSENAIKITINWEDYSMDKDLISISNKIELVPRIENKLKGTTLIIDDLRDWWSEAMIKRVYRYALDIIQPFSLSKETTTAKNSDPGFVISCYKDNLPVADTQTMFFDLALAEISGGIDNSSNGFWEIKNSKVDADTSEKELLENKYDLLSGVKFKAYYFIYGQGLIPSLSEGYIREISKEQGGIRLYRNGFRVLPYGEPNNDWIGLDESVRRRSILPTHTNLNFFGFVEINGENINFQELSSREGLFYNDAYKQLVDFLFKAITSAVIRIAEARGRKIKTNQEGWESKTTRSPKEAVTDAVELLESVANELEKESTETDSNSNSSNEEKEKGKQKKEKAKQAREKAEELKKALEQIEEINMLRVLAGLGIVIGEFTHEIFQYLTPFDVDTKYLIDNLIEGTKEHKKAVDLKQRFESFRVYASYFDETVSENVNRELKPIELRHAINPFFNTLKKDLERNNITIDISYLDIDLYTCKMHISEWASILFNLYSNSKKALKRSGTKDKKIKIVAGKVDEKVFVEFLDNGDGIPSENRDKIFNAFFTTSSPKSKSSNSTDELTGTGLGLKIIKDIVESYQGEISIENPHNNYSTNIRIELPTISKEEMPNDNF